MRDRSGWHRGLIGRVKDAWPSGSASLGLGSFGPGDLFDVELGLYLLETAMPGCTAADTWTLLGGYPYSEAFGHAHTDAERLRIRRARHYLWDLRRRREWRLSVESYLRVPQELRGYDLKNVDAVPERRSPSRAAERFDRYEQLLTSAPTFSEKRLPVAGAGQYSFPVRDRRYSVTFTDDLLAGAPVRGHDLDALPPGGGRPLSVTWSELEEAAGEMDAVEAADPGGKRNQWVMRLARVHLLVREESQGAYRDSNRLVVEGLLNLVGMVGAGKSTLRDILAYWAATRRGLRTTIVVGDVAETLAVVDLFNRLGVRAAPVLGHSTRERNIQRLHRRVASSGVPSMLTHEHPGFAFLSSACAVDALRGLEADRPLRIGEAPCLSLTSVEKAAPVTVDTVLGSGAAEPPEPHPGSSEGKGRGRRRPVRHSCALWDRCPRHHAARELVDARIWVATPAGLVHSGIPQPLHAEQMRYLELACRMSDLIIVDEADRVQMHLDSAFAPATTLLGRSPNSWLDEVAGHKLTELARQGRLQLSARDVDDWTAAVNTVSTAADRLYALLVPDGPLRRWITEDYFSALTLHQWLINAWFPDLNDDVPDAEAGAGEERRERERARERIDHVLDRFRDDPLQQQVVPASEAGAEAGTGMGADTATDVETVNRLVQLTLELLHVHHGSTTRERVRSVLLDLVGGDPSIVEDLDAHATRFEFTLILAALHHRLNFMTVLWQRVEAVLNLEATSNVLSRRPPKDYEAVIPESPMGNVLGFQFQPSERDRDGHQSGELRFFRCGGVGRELLRELAGLPSVDGRPGPNVLLMSATSWAGTSSRYHVHAEVGAILRPHRDEVEAILRTSFRKEFLHWPGQRGASGRGGAIRLSGADPEQRKLALTEALRQLAEPDRSLNGTTSVLDQELEEIDDPERRRILLLVGSYEEAKRAAQYLNSIPEWNGRVTRLVSDDADLDTTWAELPGDPAVRALRRGDVATFAGTGGGGGAASGQLLVAPLLAVERGHNIVTAGGKAAIGSVYFLARPHPRPDDIELAVQAVNDWAVRQIRGPRREFHQAALAAGTPDAAGLAFRSTARKKWNRFLTRRLSWTSLPEDEKTAFTWDQLVVMWQVIGRLVRGGVPARVVFVDAAFSPREAGLNAVDTPATSLLTSMRHLLAPYFDASSALPSIDKSLVTALYEPLYRALAEMD